MYWTVILEQSENENNHGYQHAGSMGPMSQQRMIKILRSCLNFVLSSHTFKFIKMSLRLLYIYVYI